MTTFGIPSSSEIGANVSLPLPYGAAHRQAAAYVGDVKFIAGTRLTCERWAAMNISAHCYRFNTRPAGFSNFAGVKHFSDLAFIFNNLNGDGYKPSPFEDKPQSYTQLSNLMTGSWISFVNKQDPNAWTGTGRNATRSDWPQYSTEDPHSLIFDANVTTYSAPDTWRSEGIALINANQLNYQR